MPKGNSEGCKPKAEISCLVGEPGSSFHSIEFLLLMRDDEKFLWILFIDPLLEHCWSIE